MSKEEFEQLEALLSKLRGVLGKRYCLIPEYLQDGVYLATYDQNGNLWDKVTATKAQLIR